MELLRLNQLMALLTAAIGQPFSIDQIDAWHGLLADIPDDALEAAFQRACCECKAWPSVALIREYAADAQHGTPSSIPDVWERVLKAVQHFGCYRKADARAAIPPLVWRALGGDVGWDWLCEMEARDRGSFAAQFRDKYRELRDAELRLRRLPEEVRPRIENAPICGAIEGERKALPAASPETRIVATTLRSVDAEPAVVDVGAEQERQVAAMRRRMELSSSGRGT